MVLSTHQYSVHTVPVPALLPRARYKLCGCKLNNTTDVSPYRYFVGTYEARPGAGAADYTNPSPDYTAGSHQGDGPTGTLTSETFTIGGDYGSEVNFSRIENVRSLLISNNPCRTDHIAI